jgi:probable H4MPT-linked C1 transfer pathway protein
MSHRHSSADVLALDVGGANIKAADGRGWTHAEPFAMWKESARLGEVLTRIVSDAAPAHVVATMTGEIADCFVGRSEGVGVIVNAVVAACAAVGRAAPRFYRLDGRMVSAAEAVAEPLSVAASNWHAVARLAGSLASGPRALLVDVGSTTTDIVPLAGGRPEPFGGDDTGRMLTGELVYTGIERTPVAAIVRALPHRGLRRPVASERFADSRDAWLLTGDLPEDPGSRDTADGGAFTADAARVRLARTMLLDPGDVSATEAVEAARHVVAAQARLVARALARVAALRGRVPETVVVSGHGEPLVRRALDKARWQPDVITLSVAIGEAASRCAPAHALALIARGDLP